MKNIRLGQKEKKNGKNKNRERERERKHGMERKKQKLTTVKNYGSGGIRTHAPGETGALIQRLRPLGHATVCRSEPRKFVLIFKSKFLSKCLSKMEWIGQHVSNLNNKK